MRRFSGRLTRFGAATLAAIGVVTAASGAGSPAAADSTCTVLGTLPGQVSVGAAHVSVRSVLTPSAACLRPGDENSAAYLYAGTRAVDVSVWDHFGDSYTFDLAARELRPGTYSLREGIVLVWDDATKSYTDVDWRVTSTQVRYAARVTSVTTSRTGTLTTVRAVLKSYHPSVDGYLPLPGATVVVQRAHRNSDDWVTIGKRTTDSAGRIALGHRTSGHWIYRVRSLPTASVWGTLSGRFYR